ncbi:helix-turn-helix transcriptional regulator [Fulvivirga sp. M361]|uniref:helix-turn-helix transcriptional regulator n=1 Tax=Fulvivirga sp. M361 TaxID=2594266 RepID=UPI0016286736|nr:helix-turn-helix transcriptional regulator [Fulvivirga sp. M361]
MKKWLFLKLATALEDIMKVLEFDLKKGIYRFEINDLNSENHSHPVVEIIAALEGTFLLETNGKKERNVVFAIIDSNIAHKVTSQNCTAALTMIESHNSLLNTFFDQLGIPLTNGVFVTKVNTHFTHSPDKIRSFALRRNLIHVEDERINKCLQIIENEGIEYDKMVAMLTSKVFLSKSRLSHLFKEHIGISIKKYLVWSRLKKATNLVLREGINLTQASVQSGFFDQAHLSNAFKNILGITPAKAYNSRTLQF